MALHNSEKLQAVKDRGLPQEDIHVKKLFRKNSKHKRVFLYGLKEEVQLIGDLVFGDERVPYAEPPSNQEELVTIPKGVEGWYDAEALSIRLSKSLNLSEIPREFVSYAGLRALGSGLQNLLDLKDWIAFLEYRLQKLGVELVTYMSIWENQERQKEVFRREISQAGRPVRIRKARSALEIVTNLPPKVIHRGKLVNHDLTSKFVNTVNGIRVTTPAIEEKWEKTFHFFGASEVYGAHLKDSETVASFFSPLAARDNFRVLNHGMGGVNFIDIIGRLLSTNFMRGDVVFLTVPFTGHQLADIEIGLPSDCFLDSYHLNAQGAEKVSSILFESFGEYSHPSRKIDEAQRELAGEIVNVYKAVICEIEASEFEGSDLEAYEAYLDSEISKIQKSDDVKIFGSVAVNCNPITKGHLALIQYAASSVDYLFVLVIEEDKSAVSFSDRFNMVQDVCADIENVKVLRGGKFVCTEYIAPEYFVKDEEQPENVDFSLESFYFGNYIAPKLGVTRIFLGEEPSCNVTQQYNDHMAATMPSYGIELTIIPRIANEDGQIISASKVRKLIAKKDWELVKTMVPDRALTYMQKHPVLRSDA